jgi:uncharacterized membrane protein
MKKRENLIFYPFNSLNKTSLIIIGFIFFSFFAVFSFLWFYIGAWPISIFMGLEYVVLSYLIFLFFKKRKIKENIKIDDKKITYKFYKNKNLKKEEVFNLYWTKIIFWKEDNKSKLILIESGKRLEIGKFLHSDVKESAYKKIKNCKAE